MQSGHAKERMSERGVTQEQIDDAMANPLHREQIKTDSLGKRSQKVTGREAMAVVNPDTGVIITTYRTKSRCHRKYERAGGGRMNEEQLELPRSLGLATNVEELDDDQLVRIEDRLSEEMQLRGLNAEGNGLNAHGELCRSAIEALP